MSFEDLIGFARVVAAPRICVEKPAMSPQQAVLAMNAPNFHGGFFGTGPPIRQTRARGPMMIVRARADDDEAKSAISGHCVLAATTIGVCRQYAIQINYRIAFVESGAMR